MISIIARTAVVLMLLASLSSSQMPMKQFVLNWKDPASFMVEVETQGSPNSKQVKLLESVKPLLYEWSASEEATQKLRGEKFRIKLNYDPGWMMTYSVFRIRVKGQNVIVHMSQLQSFSAEKTAAEVAQLIEERASDLAALEESAQPVYIFNLPPEASPGPKIKPAPKTKPSPTLTRPTTDV